VRELDGCGADATWGGGILAKGAEELAPAAAAGVAGVDELASAAAGVEIVAALELASATAGVEAVATLELASATAGVEAVAALGLGREVSEAAAEGTAAGLAAENVD
jgi:hypothetical protein